VTAVKVNYSTLLRQQGFNVTAQRLAILRAVDERPHGTADELLEGVRSEIGSISRQSVYDTLNTLSEFGLLNRIQPMGSPARYETRTGDNHHHLICRGCNRVEDVDCAVGARPCLSASENHGFIIDEAEVIYWGYCPTCTSSQSLSPSMSPPPNEERKKEKNHHEHK
jgi:Fe2+ or Zn2+ uptake regulation protein